MKFALKSIVAAAAFAAAGLANAASLTWHEGDNNGLYLSGTGALSFSASLIGALNAGGVQVAAIDPAVVTTTMKAPPKDYQYKTVSIAAPVQSLTVTSDVPWIGATLSINEVRTTGGALQTATADDFTTTGGSLAITNLRVNLDTKKVYADLNGANGLGTRLGVDMWDITNVTGPTSIVLNYAFFELDGPPVTQTFANTLSGLKINAAAFAMFSQALGLTIDGENALRGVTDFGTINSTITVSNVPEPSSYAMLAMGLVGLGAAACRRKASVPQPTTTHQD